MLCRQCGGSGSVFYILHEEENAIKEKKTYHELQIMFGEYYAMPPETLLEMSEIEYRCPYRRLCPTGANCFVVATPAPLEDKDILYIRCRLAGQKIPIYANVARTDVA